MNAPAHIPQLGRSVKAVLSQWRMLDLEHTSPVPGMRLVGWSIFDDRRFDWMQGVLWRLFDATGNAPSTRRLATEAERQAIQYALSEGAFQVQLEPRPGITGRRITPPLGSRVYHRATGRLMPYQ